jgi:hypothetical protein
METPYPPFSTLRILDEFIQRQQLTRDEHKYLRSQVEVLLDYLDVQLKKMVASTT